MSAVKIMSLVQASLALGGTAWKRRQGFAIWDATSLVAAVRTAGEEPGGPWQALWLEALTGVRVQGMRDHWPWFSLHLFLYVGQLVPLVVIVMAKSSPRGRRWSSLWCVEDTPPPSPPRPHPTGQLPS